MRRQRVGTRSWLCYLPFSCSFTALPISPVCPLPIRHARYARSSSLFAGMVCRSAMASVVRGAASDSCSIMWLRLRLPLSSIVITRV